MRKLILSSIALLIFTASLVLFQASCKKEALAESPTIGRNMILYTLGEKAAIGPTQVWMSRLDGSDKKQIPLTIPAGSSFTGDVTLSPDGRILYVVSRPTSMGWHDEIWGVLPDGSNAAKVLDNTNNGMLDLNMKGAW